MVMSVLVYNAETWALTEHESQYFSKEHIRIARGAMRAERRFNRQTQMAESNEQFLHKHKIEEIGRVIARKKGVWIGHIWRSKDSKFKGHFKKMVQDGTNSWSTRCREEFVKYGTSIGEVLDKVNSPTELRKLFETPAVRSG